MAAPRDPSPPFRQIRRKCHSPLLCRILICSLFGGTSRQRSTKSHHLDSASAVASSSPARPLSYCSWQRCSSSAPAEDCSSHEPQLLEKDNQTHATLTQDGSHRSRTTVGDPRHLAHRNGSVRVSPCISRTALQWPSSWPGVSFSDFRSHFLDYMPPFHRLPRGYLFWVK